MTLENGDDVIPVLYFYPFLLKEEESNPVDNLVNFPVYLNLVSQDLIEALMTCGSSLLSCFF